MRTWEILQWDCGSETPIGPFVQQIEVKDDLAPVIDCPEAFTVTTGNDCASDIMLPSAITSDDCDNGTNVTIEHPWGILTGNGGTVNLEIGTHTLTYKVADGCFNSTDCTTEVTVLDDTEPVAVC